MLDFEQHHGLTHVIDKGLGPRAWEDVLEVAGPHISIIKLGWGTAALTQNLDRKLAVLREKPVVIGGTFFEVVYAKDRISDYKRWLTSLGLTHVEISDGTLEIPRGRKLELIADFARDFTVLSEVGSKDEQIVYAPYQWVEWIKEELGAGAWKVITEGREGGTAGIYRPTGEMRTGLVDEIVHEIAVDQLIFEAPTKSSQAWFVRHFGSNVNLGNIPPDEVIPLETRDRLVERYGLELIRPGVISVAEQHAREGHNLWERDPDRCCHIRKVEPLERALEPFDAWITGIRREQALTRADAQRVEWSG